MEDLASSFLPVPADEDQRPRCRLCFHIGTSSQLVEVFSKSRDLSKRVQSALGVKINRGEKGARICTVCETIVDIIQSFQAVCKQTNQLHNERRNYLLYESFWSRHEQDAVNVTEKMILNHRSEVDKSFSNVNTLSLSANLEGGRPMLVIEAVDLRMDVTPKEHVESIPATEIILCKPEIKDEPEEVEYLEEEFSEELDQEQQIASDEAENDNSDSDSDFRLDEIDPAPSESVSEAEETYEEKKVKTRKDRKKQTDSMDEEKEEMLIVMDPPRRRGRKKKIVTKKEQTDDDDEYEPREKGKRGPRRKKVRKSDPSVCQICGQTVAYFVKESHHNQHLGIRPYKCDYEGCGRTYFSRNDLRTHSKRHQISYHVCEICGRNIKGVEWFRRHVKTHTEGPQFTCEVCGSKFRRKAQLQTHMVTHTGLTPHECATCGKRFALKYNLEAHVKRHQKREEPEPDNKEAKEQEKTEEVKKENVPEKRTWKYYVKPDPSGKKHHVTCETCGQSIHKREMEGHVNKHLGRRPYSCDIPGCTLAFYGLRGIKEHKMVVHSDKVIRYECSICNRSIKGSGTFKRHVMLHNADMKVSCQHCGKKFTSKSYLKAHELKHTGERPFVCEVCGRSFAMKACWKMHMKTVHQPGKPPKKEPKRPARKRKATTKKETPCEPVNEQQQQQQVIVEQPVVTQPSQSTWTINIQTAEPYTQSQQQQGPLLATIPQQQQVIVQIVEAPSYATVETVRTDHSY
uniref:Putative c2h2-type zn-finger protein n=1 Tax=Culex tarsalis TaxID=7177 RepID=A0A1Q3EXF7_CULTA